MSIGERAPKRNDGDGGRPPAARRATGSRRPGRPRALPVEEQRRLILDAGRRVFARDGYNGSTIERVAREAGMPRSSVYELFSGKDNLFVTVVDDSAERFVNHMVRGLSYSEGYPLREFARHNFATVFDLIETDRDSITVLLNAERGGMEPPMAAVAQTRRRVLEEINRYAGQARWSDLGLDIGSTSIMLSLMYFGMAEAVALHQADDDSWDREALIDLLTEFTVGGVFRLSLHPDVLLAARRRPERES